MIEWYEPDRKPCLRLVALVVAEIFLVTQVLAVPQLYAQVQFDDSLYKSEFLQEWERIWGTGAETSAADEWVAQKEKLQELQEQLAEEASLDSPEDTLAQGGDLESFSGAIPLGAPGGPENPDEFVSEPDESGVVTAEGDFSNGNSYVRYEFEEGNVQVNNYIGTDPATRTLDSVFIYDPDKANVFSWYDAQGQTIFQSFQDGEAFVYYNQGDNAGNVMAAVDMGADEIFHLSSLFYDNIGDYLNDPYAEFTALLYNVEDSEEDSTEFNVLSTFLTQDSDDRINSKYYDYEYDVIGSETYKKRSRNRTLVTDLENGLEEGAEALYLYRYDTDLIPEGFILANQLDDVELALGKATDEGESVVLALRVNAAGEYTKTDAYSYNSEEDRLGDLLWSMSADGVVEETRVDADYILDEYGAFIYDSDGLRIPVTEVTTTFPNGDIETEYFASSVFDPDEVKLKHVYVDGTEEYYNIRKQQRFDDAWEYVYVDDGDYALYTKVFPDGTFEVYEYEEDVVLESLDVITSMTHTVRYNADGFVLENIWTYYDPVRDSENPIQIISDTGETTIYSYVDDVFPERRPSATSIKVKDLVDKIIDTETEVVLEDYFYELDDAGFVTKTYRMDYRDGGELLKTYGKEGQIQSQYDFIEETETTYENGRIKTITDKDGTAHVYSYPLDIICGQKIC